MDDSQPSQSTTTLSYPRPRRTKAVGNHIGLTQAYELRDLASEHAYELRDCEAVTVQDKASRAQALRNLASVWEVASERIRIIKGKPMPGSLRPMAKVKKIKATPLAPSEQPSVDP